MATVEIQSGDKAGQRRAGIVFPQHRSGVAKKILGGRLMGEPGLELGQRRRGLIFLLLVLDQQVDGLNHGLPKLWRPTTDEGQKFVADFLVGKALAGNPRLELLDDAQGARPRDVTARQ